MHSDEKDSMTKLIRDVESAEEEGCCGYFGRKRCCSCTGCPVKDEDEPCDAFVYRDLARRLHALMPHDADGREVKVGDTIKWANRCRCDKVCGMVVRATDEGGFSLTNNGDNYIVVQPDSWEKLEEDANLGCRDYCKKHRLEECDYNMRMHILARAKALAKAGDGE